jgi:hypothetical protein
LRLSPFGVATANGKFAWKASIEAQFGTAHWSSGCSTANMARARHVSHFRRLVTEWNSKSGQCPTQLSESVAAVPGCGSVKEH